MIAVMKHKLISAFGTGYYKRDCKHRIARISNLKSPI